MCIYNHMPAMWLHQVFKQQLGPAGMWLHQVIKQQLGPADTVKCLSNS